MNSIKGKKILFLSPTFFNYEDKIKNKMEQMGAIVDFYDERSIKNSISRAILKVIPCIFNKKTLKYYESIMSKNINKNYDYILIIKCDMITEKILKEIKRNFKDSIMCLYLWDSMNNIKGIKNKIKYFDRVFSFDTQDVMENSVIKFRPLFYIDELKNKNIKNNLFEYDICFFGTIHSNRYDIIKKIIKISEKQKIKFYKFCYLQSKFIYYFYKLFKKEFRGTTKEEFDFNKMSSREIFNIVNKSRIILDIQHPKQKGLTMRTIEMIGMNKKIITTNSEIKKYDFYNENNICIIDLKNIVIPSEFIKKEYIMLSEELYYKYSLESWINDVLLN